MWKTDIDFCKQCTCGTKRPIVNRTHWLCQEKNDERLGKGKRVEKPLKNFTRKRENKEEEYRKLKASMLTPESVCHACGSAERLSFSHLIPRSRRPDLIADKRNVVLHCMSYGGRKGCHDLWEEGNITLGDYNENMSAIKEMDPEYYELLKLNHGALR